MANFVFKRLSVSLSLYIYICSSVCAIVRNQCAVWVWFQWISIDDMGIPMHVSSYDLCKIAGAHVCTRAVSGYIRLYECMHVCVHVVTRTDPHTYACTAYMCIHTLINHTNLLLGHMHVFAHM